MDEFVEFVNQNSADYRRDDGIDGQVVLGLLQKLGDI
jgi:hypothetical protein